MRRIKAPAGENSVKAIMAANGSYSAESETAMAARMAAEAMAAIISKRGGIWQYQWRHRRLAKEKAINVALSVAWRNGENIWRKYGVTNLAWHRNGGDNIEMALMA